MRDNNLYETVAANSQPVHKKYDSTLKAKLSNNYRPFKKISSKL